MKLVIIVLWWLLVAWTFFGKPPDWPLLRAVISLVLMFGVLCWASSIMWKDIERR